MDYKTVVALISEEGQRLTGLIDGLDSSPTVADLTRLRGQFPPEMVAHAATLVQLRERAKKKFPCARQMLFDREGLEQATSYAVAQHRSERFAGAKKIIDLCCGIGSDSSALIGHAPVTMVDINPARVLMAMCNVDANWAHNLPNRLEGVAADVTQWLPRSDAIMLDPSRRVAGRRMVDPANYRPAISILESLRKITSNICIKVAPGIDHAHVPDGMEAEWVSLSGDCSEADLWGGRFVTTRRRATALASGETITTDEPPEKQIAAVGKYIVDPDAAVVRAHLVQRLAGRIDGWRLDERIAYLSCDRLPKTSLGRVFEVSAVMQYKLPSLKAYLNEKKVGRLEILRRRFPIEPEDLRKRLKLSGKNGASLICTRIFGKMTVIVCTPVVLADRP